MKKVFLSSVIASLLIIYSMPSWSDSGFVGYYNKNSHWNSSNIGDGALIINDNVSLYQNVVLPDNVEVVINNGGSFNNNGYKFSITGDPANPGAEDPGVIYSGRMNLSPVYYLLLSHN